MKKNVTYIDQVKFEEIVRGCGLPWQEQKGFVKIQASPGRCLYVARTKRVGRVDLAGFRFQDAGVRDLGGESFGAVEQQLDFSRTEAEILATFEAATRHAMTLPARVREPRAQLEPKAPKVPAVETVVDQSTRRKSERRAAAERLARMRQVSSEMGAPISADAEASLIEASSSPEGE